MRSVRAEDFSAVSKKIDELEAFFDKFADAGDTPGQQQRPQPKRRTPEGMQTTGRRPAIGPDGQPIRLAPQPAPDAQGRPEGRRRPPVPGQRPPAPPRPPQLAPQPAAAPTLAEEAEPNQAT